MTMFLIIAAVGCLFGSALLNINAAYGDMTAMKVRNALLGAGIALLIISTISAIISGGAGIGAMFMACSIPFITIAAFLGLFAAIGVNSSSKGAYYALVKTALATAATALPFLIIGGLIMILTVG